MGVPLKTENEECAGKTLQMSGSEGGRRGVTGTCQLGVTCQIPREPSARLTHGLELAMKVWRLRCSVFRGTPMAFFCVYFKDLNCYEEAFLLWEGPHGASGCQCGSCGHGPAGERN